MTLVVRDLAYIMQTFNVKQLGMTMSDLQGQYDYCENRRRESANHLGTFVIPNRDPANSRPTNQDVSTIVDCLIDAQNLCDESGWHTAQEKIALIRAHIDNHRSDCDWSSLSADLRNTIDVLLSSAWVTKCALIANPYSEYVNNDILLGEEINKAFPSAVEDIREAGNCLAVDCGTAAVFHLMRAVEWGLRALCVDLGVLIVPKKNTSVPIEYSEWEKILDQLYPAVESKVDTMPRGPAKQETQEFYFSILQDIRGFKDAFRNHVMHTRKTYSQKAASGVLDYVRRFLELLSTKISE